MKKYTVKQAAGAVILPILAVVAMVLTGNNIVIALLSTIVVETVYCLLNGIKYQEIEDSLLKGGSNVLGAVLIACWIASGTIPTLLYYEMEIISPALFLPVTFILCFVTAIATGTSWGSAGTMGIALIGVATGLGMPLPLVCGAIISGALIGDKLSPLSDSVLLASASSGTNIFDLIVSMLYTTVPLSIISIILYGVLGIRYSNANINLETINTLLEGLDSTFTINPAMQLPLLIVLVMSIKKIPAFATFTVGIVVSIIMAAAFQNTSLTDVMGATVNRYVCESGIEELDSLLTRGGALSMAQVVFAALMAGMFSGTLKYLGFLDVLIDELRKVIKNSTSLVIMTVCVCLVLMFGGGGQYTTLTLPGVAFRKFYDEMDVHSSVLGRTMEDVGTMIDCAIPWTVSGIYYSGLFGVAVGEYLPFTFMALLSPVIAILNAVLGLGIFRCNDRISYHPFRRRTKDAEK